MSEAAAALRWTNWQRREALVADLEERRMNSLLDESEWSPCPTPAPVPTPPAPARTAPDYVTRERVIGMLAEYSDLVGEFTAETEAKANRSIKSLRDDVTMLFDSLQNQINGLQSQIDNLRADQNRSWFNWRKS